VEDASFQSNLGGDHAPGLPLIHWQTGAPGTRTKWGKEKKPRDAPPPT